jgi:hypothetical protein
MVNVSSPLPPTRQPIDFTQYTLFLTTSTGEVGSLFPFLPNGCLLSRECFSWISEKEENEDGGSKDEDSQCAMKRETLREYLDNCKMKWDEFDRECAVVGMPEDDSYFQMVRHVTGRTNPAITSSKFRSTIKTQQEQ